MRDLTNIAGLLDRASALQQDGPTYRFHGHQSPTKRERVPILGSAPSSNVKDGVAKLRLYAPIDSWGGPWGVSAVEFLEVLDDLDDSVSTIELHLNSPGGEVWEALAILNSIRSFDAKFVAVVDGIAASCASFIACAADETIMAPNSQLMIHDAMGICIGRAADMHQTGDVLDKVSDNIASIYADKAGESIESMRTTMLAETWYLAQEAVDAGLADSIQGEEPTDDPANGYDLKGIGLKFAGRSEAPPPPSPKSAADSTAPVPDLTGTDERRLRHQERRHTVNASRVG